MRKFSLVIGFTGLCLLAVCFRADGSPTRDLLRQWGTVERDNGYNIAFDGAGNLYVAGYTKGDMSGACQGDYDAFVSKFDSTGVWEWTTQIGTTEKDLTHGLVVDDDGNCYISGTTGGALNGESYGGDDIFVSKLNTTGIVEWTTQLGTEGQDEGWGISLDDSDRCYITGYTNGAMIEGEANIGGYDIVACRLTTTGEVSWTTQIGTTANDYGLDVVVDHNGYVLTTGYTWGDMDGENEGDRDIVVTKYTATGHEMWTTQIGTESLDISYGIDTDNTGNCYITGYTEGDLGSDNEGEGDVFVSKISTTGGVRWTTQLGTVETDRAYGIATDKYGSSYITGYTEGDMDSSNEGMMDIFTCKVNTIGTILWTEQLGTTENDMGMGVAVNDTGTVFVTGGTCEDLDGAGLEVYAGGDSFDAFLLSYLQGLIGDYNNDDTVDQADYTIWADSFGDTGVGLPADGNNDEVVDQADYTIWADHYGESASSPAAVPEPGTFAMLGVGVFGLLKRRRK